MYLLIGECFRFKDPQFLNTRPKQESICVVDILKIYIYAKDSKELQHDFYHLTYN